MKHIDQLPNGPNWKCTPLCITGDKVDKHGRALAKEVELWHRDPVECIRELLGNPAFKNELQYKPVKIYRNADYTNREYSEMWTGDWWWEIQVHMKCKCLEQVG